MLRASRAWLLTAGLSVVYLIVAPPSADLAAQQYRTDLAKAVPLCGWHHRRIHDPAYRHSVTTAPTGAKSVTFHLRT